ncbi:MAG: DUF3365 domain-containing protein [Desulfobacteraceae bacterium]|nr:DUF3365 domain-containing protein [Desulfobacteraceae bacterium]
MGNLKKHFKVIAAVMVVCFFVMAESNAAAPQDGLYYFNAMKEAVIEVIDEHQDLFNKTPDGAVKNPKLTGKNYYRSVYKIFKTIIGADFSPKLLKGVKDPVQISHMLCSLLQAGRVATAKNQKIINTEKDGSVKLKKFIPAVFGRLVAERYLKKTGVAMKQTTLGKGIYKARNPYNYPDEWESTQLDKFTTTNWPLNKGIGEDLGSEYRYIKPIYIKKACMSCHGEPIGEKGPYGHLKEGYKVGDIRGGISIILEVSH